MTQKCGVDFLRDACLRNTLNRYLQKYIESCRERECLPVEGLGELFDDELPKKRASKKERDRFPNVAGFCRYYHVSIDALDALERDFPEQIGKLYTIFEDEALNSGLPPAVISAYLKKRLGYEREGGRRSFADEGITVRFEHDVLSDGE